jgi:hypothetical protein
MYPRFSETAVSNGATDHNSQFVISDREVGNVVAPEERKNAAHAAGRGGRKAEGTNPGTAKRHASYGPNLNQISKLLRLSNSPLHFSPALDINNSPRADVWQPVVFLNLSWHPGI